MIRMIVATKAQKVSQKSNTPQVPYITITKDCNEKAIMFSLKGGARDIVQGGKNEQYIAFGLCENATNFGIKILKDITELTALKTQGIQTRVLKKDINLSGGFGCSSLKKSPKNDKGLDFSDINSVYTGTLQKVNKKEFDGFEYIAVLTKE